MSDYYSNGRPKWDDQFRESQWERNERQRKRRAQDKITQTPGNNAEERTAPEPQPLNAGAVRKPTIDCPACAGRGETYGYGTNDPGEKLKRSDCEECGGSGEVPEPEPEMEEE